MKEIIALLEQYEMIKITEGRVYAIKFAQYQQEITALKQDQQRLISEAAELLQNVKQLGAQSDQQATRIKELAAEKESLSRELKIAQAVAKADMRVAEVNLELLEKNQTQVEVIREIGRAHV